MRVLITGARGLLGSELLRQAPAEYIVAGVDIEEGDLSQASVAQDLISRHQPHCVIHCAAWTDVDGCTRDPERAYRVNAEATQYVAAACQQFQARLVYLSTDYVFAGDLGRPYTEEDEPRPLNPYGSSKLAGEKATAALPNYLIVRTQWLFGPAGKNFIATIIRAAREKGELRVVADEWGSPTYARDLAAALWQIAPSTITGIVHLTNRGICSWHELAVFATQAAGINVPIVPISSREWNSPTVRPRYTPLANKRWQALGFAPLRPWQEAVAEYVREYLTSS